jgi:hypothetical protein
MNENPYPRLPGNAAIDSDFNLVNEIAERAVQQLRATANDLLIATYIGEQLGNIGPADCTIFRDFAQRMRELAFNVDTFHTCLVNTHCGTDTLI